MKRRRGRPATKDKSVGTGPTQPSINKAVQVKKIFIQIYALNPYNSPVSRTKDLGMKV
jgi:hypothetical protein